MEPFFHRFRCIGIVGIRMVAVEELDNMETAENLSDSRKVFSSKIEHSCPYVVGRLPQADGVLHLNDGRYALLEFKPGTKEIEEGAKHLLEIEELIRQYSLRFTVVESFNNHNINRFPYNTSCFNVTYCFSQITSISNTARSFLNVSCPSRQVSVSQPFSLSHSDRPR